MLENTNSTNEANREIIIFTHFGFSDYLLYTLNCAKKTNKNAWLIFLGDENNRDIAIESGWDFYSMDEYLGSSLDLRFLRVFRHIQGTKHNHIKNGKDWLKFVFERWFAIESFINFHNIERIWHFDSDTMIVGDLIEYSYITLDYDYSVQCNGACLNGFATRSVITEYCTYICELFENEEFIARQVNEFKYINTNYAFTEMRAFDEYIKRTTRNGLHLLYFSKEKIFDDCLAQCHNFEMARLKDGLDVKNVRVSSGCFWGVHKEDGKKIFITLNLSWVPIEVFQWVFDNIGSSKNSSIEHVKFSKFKMFKFMTKSIRRHIKEIFKINT